jgi:hypothetical protein
MKNTIRFTAPVIALAMMSIAPAFVRAQSAPQNNQTQNAPAEEWNTPPAGTEQAQQGYRDGLLAAKLDITAKRKVDAQASHLYQHPPVKGAAREEYRTSFTAGYQAALKHSGSGGE